MHMEKRNKQREKRKCKVIIAMMSMHRIQIFDPFKYKIFIPCLLTVI